MVPGIGGAELIVIAAVALIVVGPKDLPKLLRKAGQFFGRMRAMADEFRQSFDDMARQTEIDELRLEVEALKSGRTAAPIVNEVMDDLYRLESDLDEKLAAPAGGIAAKKPTDLGDANSQTAKKPRQSRKVPNLTKPVPLTETVDQPLDQKPRRRKAKAMNAKDGIE